VENGIACGGAPMLQCPLCKQHLLGVFEHKIGVAGGMYPGKQLVCITCSRCRGQLGFMPDMDALRLDIVREVTEAVRSLKDRS